VKAVQLTLAEQTAILTTPCSSLNGSDSRLTDLVELVRDAIEPAPDQRHSPTSVAAARQIEPVRETLRDHVYHLIADAGPITDEAIATTLGLNPSTARPRRVELVALGLVRAAPELHKTSSGRSAMAWVAVTDRDF
jgi:hypothetical protein